MRRRLIVTACLVFALIAGAMTYKKWAPLLHKPSNDGDAVSSQPGVSSVPPFATKEPERYQATRTVTFIESATNPTTPVNERRTTSVLIVRDGDQRREEYEAGALGTIAYLENAAGRFVLLPRAKLYADLLPGADEPVLSELENDGDQFSPDRLLNESPIASRYERLGAETISGRATTKYRVTTSVGTENAPRSESLIWIDEALSMPIKSESIHTNSEHWTKVLMELQDMSSEVDKSLFALPADYRRVAASTVFSMVRQSTSQIVPTRGRNAPERE